MRAFTRLLRIMCALALAAMLAACSAIKLGYGTLDDLGYWWLNGHFDFTETQGERVRGELDRLHDWHRVHELPRLADVLHRIEQMAPGDVTAAQACALVPELQARLKAVAQQAEPAVADIARQLSPREISRLEAKHRESNAKWAKDWLNPPPLKVVDKRVDQWVERLEMIYGRLDGGQRTALRAGVEQSRFDPHRIFRERQRRQQDLVQILKKVVDTQPPAAEVRVMLRAYVERSIASPEPAYRAYQQSMIDEGCALFASVHARTSAEQRDHASKRLRGYQRDLLDLSAAGARH